MQSSVHILFSLSRLAGVLSPKETFVPSYSFLPVLLYGGPLYFAGLASLWQTVFDFLSRRLYIIKFAISSQISWNTF